MARTKKPASQSQAAAATPDRGKDGKFLPDAQRKPGRRAAREVREGTQRDRARRPTAEPKQD